jgi:hypothetical protein
VEQRAANIPSVMMSRWWSAVCLTAIAAWVAVTMIGAYVWPGGEAGGRYAFVIYGAVFFGWLFGYAAWTTRRLQLRTRSDLYERLALMPVSDETLRASTRGMYSIGYVYFAAGMIATALGLGAVAAAGTPWEARLIRVSIGIVVLWFMYMLYALRQVKSLSAGVFAPLGLQLVSVPSLPASLFGDVGAMRGAVSYAGQRRGRDVSIVLAAEASVTVVSGPTGTTRLPVTPDRMAALTGQQPSCFRDVTVTIADGHVIVERRGRGIGRWFLHDMLLAESVAGPLPESDSRPGEGPRGAPVASARGRRSET